MRQQENRQQRQTQTKQAQEPAREAHTEIDKGRREVELGCRNWEATKDRGNKSKRVTLNSLFVIFNMRLS